MWAHGGRSGEPASARRTSRSHLERSRSFGLNKIKLDDQDRILLLAWMRRSTFLRGLDWLLNQETEVIIKDFNKISSYAVESADVNLIL